MITVDYIVDVNQLGDGSKYGTNIDAVNGFFLATFRNDPDIKLRIVSDVSDSNKNNIIIANSIDLTGIADFTEPSSIRYPYDRRDYIHRLMDIYGVNNPKTINLDLHKSLNIVYMSKKLYDANFDLNDSSQIAIRKQKTARSLGNLVIPVSDIPNFISMLIDIKCANDSCDIDSIGLIAEKNKIKLPDNTKRGYWYNEDEKNSLEKYLTSSYEFTIQEVIPKIVEEFRFYYHAGIKQASDFKYAVHRNGFSLNSDKENMKEEIYWTKDKQYDFSLLYPILNRLIKMFKEQKLLTASIDIAIDMFDNVWCLEFSTEFVFDGLSPENVITFTNDIKQGLIDYKMEK